MGSTGDDETFWAALTRGPNQPIRRTPLTGVSSMSIAFHAVGTLRVPLLRRNVGLATLLLALTLVAGCSGDRSVGDPSNESGETSSAPSPTGPAAAQGTDDEWFVDRARETGLDFIHFNGASGEFYFPEIMGPGVGMLDYDNDGDLDIYFVQGQMLGAGKTLGDALFPPPGARAPKGRLYRNDLQESVDGKQTLAFTDVTDASGIVAGHYGMGVAAADVDNDGWVDLYLTNFGSNQLFHNNGDGTLTDVSETSGVDDTGWGVSASFFDYDRDGWLDLYVGNYANYTIEADTRCPGLTGGRDYCPPRVYRASPDRLYRNQGNGRFVDVTASALLGRQFGPALGVVTADFNGDGWVDIYVANDGEENQLWINRRDGTFVDVAVVSGAALSVDGAAEAGMGVDAGDFDSDGDEDLFITHLMNEGNNLYVNDGVGIFEDESARSGLGPSSLRYTGFGTAWFDFDNDGWLDVLAVNGTVTAVEGRAGEPFPYDLQKLLFRNLGDGRFENVTDQAGAVFQLSEVGRGAAFGDVDNDGDVDVLVGNNAGAARLLINTVGSDNHWLGVRLVGENGSRDMLGARVGVTGDDGSVLWRRARADGSYASANDPRVLVGLGESAAVVQVQVRWPSGRLEEWSEVAIDRWMTLQEGSGQ